MDILCIAHNQRDRHISCSSACSATTSADSLMVFDRSQMAKIVCDALAATVAVMSETENGKTEGAAADMTRTFLKVLPLDKYKNLLINPILFALEIFCMLMLLLLPLLGLRVDVEQCGASELWCGASSFNYIELFTRDIYQIN